MSVPAPIIDAGLDALLNPNGGLRVRGLDSQICPEPQSQNFGSANTSHQTWTVRVLPSGRVLRLCREM